MPVAALQYLALGHSDEEVKRAIVLQLDRILFAHTASKRQKLPRNWRLGLRRSLSAICRKSISRQAVGRVRKARSKWRDSISQRKTSPIEAILSLDGKAILAVMLLALN